MIPTAEPHRADIKHADRPGRQRTFGGRRPAEPSRGIESSGRNQATAAGFVPRSQMKKSGA